MSDDILIGVIGGSGLYDVPELVEQTPITIQTPFGSPSDALLTGKIDDVRVAFVARHGKGHRLSPTEVPYAANIYALKALGVKYIIAVSACGSLREDIAPGQVCLPDQLVDFTRGTRRRSFFGDGLVAHISTADPFSPQVASILADSARQAGATVHEGGIYVTIEGPRFSTRAESTTFRQLGYNIVGMTTSPEAFLAREAEIAYAVYAHVTDYDVWRDGEDVSVSTVVETARSNLVTAQQAILKAIPRLAALTEPLPAHQALQNAIQTTPDAIPAKARERLGVIVSKYLSQEGQESEQA